MKKQPGKSGLTDWRIQVLCLSAFILTAVIVRAVLPEGRSVDIRIDPAGMQLSLPGIQDATYDLQVKNALTNAWGPLDTITGRDGVTVYPVMPDDSPSRFFRVLFPQPTVSAGEPAFVPEAGGTTVYVTGQFFYAGDQIFVDGALLSNVTFISATLLSGTLPTLPPGLHTVDVVSGQSGAVLATLPDALEVSPSLERTLQGPPEWPPAGPAPALPAYRGHVTVLKSQGGGIDDDCDGLAEYRGHVTVLKACAEQPPTKSTRISEIKREIETMEWKEGMARGHVTVLKSHGGGVDDDCDGVADLRLHSGEVRRQVADLAVPGRGLDFVWTRTYRSRTGVATPQGNRWSHCYDVRCVTNGAAIDIYDGTGRKDIFRLQANGSYTCPEFFREGTLNADTGVFRLTFADTGFWEFHPFGAAAAAGKLARIQDRNGNAITLAYDGAGRLSAVTDTLSRVHTVAYTPDGRVASVTDHTGRTVAYAYCAAGDPDGLPGDLKSVTSPAVTNTPTGNDFPAGKTTTYTYTTHATAEAGSLLLTVTDALGQTALQCAYDIDPASFSAWRVIYLQRGTDQPARITYLPQTPAPDNRFVALRCLVNDPEGNVSEASFDSRNRCVALREYTGRATPGLPVTDTENRPTGKLRADDPGFFESRWRWNNDSLCTAWQRPQTNRVEWVYQADLDPSTPPRQKGNLRTERRLALSDLDGDGKDDVVVSRFEHDPRFGTGEYATLLFEDQWPCSGDLDFNDAVLRYATRVINPRGFETRCDYDAQGNRLSLTRHGADDGSGSPPALAREDFEYNSYGQLTAQVLAEDGEGRRRRDTLTYYPDGPQAGYLQAIAIDEPGVHRTSIFEYDGRGNVTRATDPRGTATDFEVNTLNQIVAKQTQGATFGERVRAEFHYDAANNLVRTDVENRDGDGTLNPTNAWLTSQYEYDALHRLTRLVQEEGVHYANLTNEYAYDGNDRLVLARSPQAVQGGDPFHVTQNTYDERGLLFRETRAPGSPLQATSQCDYDGNANLCATRSGLEDAAGPRVTAYAYDGLDRLVRETDPMGNETRYEYDASGNRTRATVYGESADVPGGAGNRRLADTRYGYDALNRLVTFRPAFFDVFTQLPIGDGFQDYTVAYAPNGLVTATTNDRGHGTTFTFDTTMFLTAVADAGTNRIDYTYDANGNVLSATQTGRSGLGGPDEVFVRGARYDALDRLVADWDNAGNTNRYAYDSRGNRVRHIDPLGFSLEGDFDSISRPTSNRKGIGGSAQNSSRAVWDAASRLVASTDGNTNTTEYAYDSLDRLSRTTLADGTSVTNVYDVHGNLVWTRDASGTEIVCVYDALGRRVQKSITPGPGVAADTTVEAYQYDGLSRLVLAANNQTVVTRAYDSLGRCVSEATESPALAFNPREYTRTLDAHGLLLAQIQPSGRIVEYSYDALDRPVSLSWRASAEEPLRSLEELAYAGPDRLARVTRANGVQTDFTYSGLDGVANSPGDFGWGQIQGVRHALGGAPAIAAFIFAHDRNQNKTLRALTEPFVPGGPTNRQAFAYDSLDRLVRSVTATNGVDMRDTAYVLDPIGNRLSVIRDGVAQLYALDPALPTPGDFQVHQYTATPFDARQYDENGNLGQTVAASPVGSVTNAFIYDYADRLVAVQGVSGPVAAYAYDALGRRIAKIVYTGLPPAPALTNRYLYADGQVIEEEDGGGSTLRTHVAPHVFDHSGPRGKSFILDGTRSQDDGFVGGGRIMIDGDGQVAYVLCDDQGSAQAVTDAKGQVVERFDYEDYGAPAFLDAEGIPQPGPSPLTRVTRLFHGMEWNEETELYVKVDMVDDSELLDCVELDPVTGSNLSRTYALPHVFDQTGRAYAGNNPWSMKREKGGRHTPFYKKYRQQSGLRTTDVTGEIHLEEGREMLSDNSTDEPTNIRIDFGRAVWDDGVEPGSVNKAELIEAIAKGSLSPSGPGGAFFDSPNVKLIIPVAINKGLNVLKTRHDTAKNSVGNIR